MSQRVMHDVMFDIGNVNNGIRLRYEGPDRGRRLPRPS